MKDLWARITSSVKSRLTYQMIVLLLVSFALISLIIAVLLYRFQIELVNKERAALTKNAELIAANLSDMNAVNIAFGVGRSIDEEDVSSLKNMTEDPSIKYVIILDAKGNRTDAGLARPPYYARFKGLHCEDVLPAANDGDSLELSGAFICRENDPSCYCVDFPEVSFGETARPVPKATEFNLYGHLILDVAVPILPKSSVESEDPAWAPSGKEAPKKIKGWIRVGLDAEEMHALASSLDLIFISIMLTLLVLGGVITGALHLVIARPIIRMARSAREIGAGRFHDKIKVTSSDELGQLGMAFNEMTDNIQGQIERNNLIINNISDTVDHISKSTAEMFSISAQQSSGATEQAASVYEASSTSKEIAASANRIADTAEEVAAFARETSAASDAGKLELGNAIAQVRDVTEKSEEVAHRMVALGEQSQKISAIIDIIKEISEQTNLLALNAAIEAAGAGESGRRFAVVAQEIRRLATRTLESTEVVREIVEEIQSSTNSTVMVTEQSMKSARESRVIIENMEAAFRNIIELVNKTLTASTEINLSTRQQTTACEQMVATIMEVSDVASEVEKGAKESEDALKRLRELSDKLHELAVSEDRMVPSE